ncbi:hypothetical protein CYY_002898 [Polysphondylium violaceum]|uniref:NEDD8-activating enzyme E1 regulatory subunit n=1 Tax=Polysphondylium violaceum TaxID=133409 RepID=A0A8J4PYL1_9MYCE|nr:hypothetical protein CYY_002898 [Polysphondylium violaceum]
MTDSEKYDRQLRLWGEDGQAKLEKSHICLLNGTALGTETLKNLVLPGIGAFTVVDSHKVAESDLGNNFFVEKKTLGQSRARVVCELLRELNDRVKGFSVEEDPVYLINNNISFFKDFSLVFANRIPETALVTLSAYLYENNIPLVVGNSYGYIGYLRVSVPEHQIIESKPDNPMDDLRIINPFKELDEATQKIELTGLNSQELTHVPYVYLMIKFIKEWKSTHDGKAPETRAEKEEFKKFFLSKSPNPDAENFAEGITNMLKVLQPYRISSDIDKLLKDEKAVNPTEQSDDFWIMVSALKSFVESHGVLPLNGNLPDMHADTCSFIQLQKIYQEKGIADLSEFSSLVDSLVSKLGKDQISSDLVKKFCKNTRFLNVVRYKSLAEEYEKPNTSVIISELEQPDNNMVYYIALRAIDKFFSTYTRYPGFHDEEVDSDLPLLKSATHALLQEHSISSDLVKDEYLAEMTRYGACELHNLSSLMGGIISQEIIKLMTHQYVPLNNTFIFNGINSTATQFTI